MKFMNFNISGNLAVLLAVCLAALLLLGYSSLQKWQNNQIWQSGPAVPDPNNYTQNGSAITGQQNQTPNGNNTQNGNITANNTQNENNTIANPASAFCVQHGGISKIVTFADGSQIGMCVFADGSECEEWAYYWGKCSPANHMGGGGNGTIIPSAFCSDANCTACANQADCIIWVSCQWNSAMNVCAQRPPSKCSDANCPACANQTDCAAYSSCQWDSASDTCNQRPSPLQCSGTNCPACANQADCNVWASCQWDSEALSCSAKPPPPANMSILYESDFMVVDDSLPSLLTNQKIFELPPPPNNSQ